MALTTDILVRATATESVVGDLQTALAPLDISARTRLDSGTGTGQADVMWTDTRTIAASGTEDIDLKASLLTPLGQAFTPAKLKFILVRAASGNTNNVNVTRSASNGVPFLGAAGDIVPVLPGGHFSWSAPGAGITVTASTGDLITIANSSSGSSVTYDIVLIGTSA